MTTLTSNTRRNRGSSGGPNKQSLNKGPNNLDNSKLSSNFITSNSSSYSATLPNQNSMPPGFDRRKLSTTSTNSTFNAWSRPNTLSTRLGSKDFGKTGSLIGNPEPNKQTWSKEPTSPTIISRKSSGAAQLNTVQYTATRHLQQNGSNLSYLQSKNVPAFIAGSQSTARFKTHNKPIQVNNDDQTITQKKESMRLPQITLEQKNKIVKYLHLQMENFEESVRETGEIDVDAGIPLGYKGDEYKKQHPDKTNFCMSGKRMGGGFVFELNEKIDKMDHMKGFKAIDIITHKMDLMMKKNKVIAKKIEDKTVVKVPLQIQKDKDLYGNSEAKKRNDTGIKSQSSFGNPKSPKLSPTMTKPPTIYKTNSQRDNRGKPVGPKANITKGNSWSKSYSKNGNGKK